MKRVLHLLTVTMLVACIPSHGTATAQPMVAAQPAATSQADLIPQSPFPVDPTTRLCVTLQVDRDVYDKNNPNEWMDFSAAFGGRLGDLNRAGNYYALSTQSEQLLFAGNASSCSRFRGYITISAKYYRKPDGHLPVFEYTMEGWGTVHLPRITRRYADEDIADPALFRVLGNPLAAAFSRVLERRSKAILDELAGKGTS